MAYVKPNTFADGTVLTAANIQGNVDALRVYLHNGIVQPDMSASQFITTRHIQPPVYSPLEGLQHGVTGYQGGQWSGSLVRLSFATSYTAGNGRNTANGTWTRVPNTAFSIDLRRQANLLFHWQIEVEAGPDDVPQVSGRTNAVDNRHAFFPTIRSDSSTRRKCRIISTASGHRRRTGQISPTPCATATANGRECWPKKILPARRLWVCVPGLRLTAARL